MDIDVLHVLFSVRLSTFVIYEVCELPDLSGMRLINRQRRHSILISSSYSLTLNVNYKPREKKHLGNLSHGGLNTELKFVAENEPNTRKQNFSNFPSEEM